MDKILQIASSMALVALAAACTPGVSQERPAARAQVQPQQVVEVPTVGEEELAADRQLLNPLPMFIDSVPLADFMADEERKQGFLAEIRGITGQSNEQMITLLEQIETDEVEADDVPEALWGINGQTTRLALRAALLDEHYLFAGKIRDYLYIDNDGDGQMGSGHLAVTMTSWRYASLADFQAGAAPTRVETLHWHIEVDQAYQVHKRGPIYLEPFDVDLPLPPEAIAAIWHPARDLRWKLHARGTGVIIREVYRQVNGGSIELLPSTETYYYGSTDDTCIDILFHPYPPKFELPPQLGYCLGRCERPFVINTGG